MTAPAEGPPHSAGIFRGLVKSIILLSIGRLDIAKHLLPSLDDDKTCPLYCTISNPLLRQSRAIAVDVRCEMQQVNTYWYIKVCKN